MGSLGSIRSGNPLSRGQPSGQTLSPVPQEVAAVILCCRREGNGPLQTQFRPPLQSPEARAAASLIVIVTVMPLPPIWPPGAEAALLALWALAAPRRAPPLAGCVAAGR